MLRIYSLDLNRFSLIYNSNKIYNNFNKIYQSRTWKHNRPMVSGKGKSRLQSMPSAQKQAPSGKKSKLSEDKKRKSNERASQASKSSRSVITEDVFLSAHEPQCTYRAWNNTI
jgi:hypothetical protein